MDKKNELLARDEKDSNLTQNLDDTWVSVDAAFEQARTDGEMPAVGALIASHPQAAVEILRRAVNMETNGASRVAVDASAEEHDDLNPVFTAAFKAALAPSVDGLSELRLEADLMVDELAEELGIPEEAALCLEERAIVDVPRPFLQLLGELLGYSANQVGALVAAPYVISGAAFRVEGGSRPVSSEDMTSPISFAQLLEDTGATIQQKERWLSHNDGAHS